MGRRSTRLLALAALLLIATPADGFELTVEAPPALAGMAARVTRMDTSALGRALSQAGLDLPPHVHVTLLDSADERVRGTPEWIVGRAFGTSRVIIIPERISSYPYGSLESVVLHEIVHLALSARAGGQPLPRWFHEGVAVSVEAGWGLGSQMRLLVAAAREPGLADVTALFESGSHPDSTSAYLLAAALVDDVRRRHGAAVPGAIAARVAGGTPFELAFAHETGESVEEAAARAWSVYRGWRHWLGIVTGPAGIWGWILALAFLAFLFQRRRRALRRRLWDAEEAQPGDGEEG